MSLACRQGKPISSCLLANRIECRPQAVTDSMRLKSKRALVTGAGSGIGRATAVRFAVEGASVVAVDIDAAAADDTAAEIRELGGEAIGLHADVSVEEQIARAITHAGDRLGGMDIVVANAAVEPVEDDDRADRLDLRVWERVIDVNLTGTFLTCKYGLPLLLASGGSLVCTASPTGLYGLAPGEDAYSASKAGVYGLIRVMANDYASCGVRVNGVIPGFIDTPLTQAVVRDEQRRIAALEAVPMKRTGRAEEVAAVITFLASDEASYVTGAVWAVDGGMTAV
jgi:NAD(P)-dependent dehydrogenase (short-subunit alcohol dehydrogenase family)